MLKNMLPAMAAMTLNLVYNLADTFFIGQTHDDLQVAAVSLATPVFMMFISISTIFGIGGTSVISRALGGGRDSYVKKVSAFCTWVGVAVGIIASALVLIFMDDLLRLMGASSGTWNHTKSYLTIVMFSGPFIILTQIFAGLLRAEGQATKAMVGMMIGNIINIILDPIFILVFKWDIAGAAIATVIGNIIGVGYYILYFRRGKSSLSVNPRHFTVREKVSSSVLAIGVPHSLGSMLMSISVIVMNGMMANFGDLAIAAMGVAMKASMITGMLAVGMGQGVGPLLGYCVGAKNWKRYKEILKFSLTFAGAFCVALCGICFIFAEPIVGLFLTEPDAFARGVQFTRILQSTAIFFGIFYCFNNAIQAMGAVMPSFIVNLSRQGLIYIPMLFLLRYLLGVIGLVWAQPIADALALTLAIILHTARFRRLSTKTEHNS